MSKTEAAADGQCVRFYSGGLQIRGLVHYGKAIVGHATLSLDDMRTLRAHLDREIQRLETRP